MSLCLQKKRGKMRNGRNGALISCLTRRPAPPSPFHFVIPALAPTSSLDDETDHYPSSQPIERLPHQRRSNPRSLLLPGYRWQSCVHCRSRNGGCGTTSDAAVLAVLRVQLHWVPPELLRVDRNGGQESRDGVGV